MGKYKMKLQKCAAGLQSVAVPPAGDPMDLVSGAVSGASAGAAAGPWGALAGGAIGLGMGIINQEKNAKLRKEAIEYNKGVTANQKYTAVNTQNTQAEQYATGAKATANTKPVEVERDELIFDKNFKLKHDFKGGKTHEQGGEPYVATEGDIIFPGAQRSEVLKAYALGDKKSLEAMRSKLPADTETKTMNEKGNPSVKTKKGANYDDLPFQEMRQGGKLLGMKDGANQYGDDIVYKQDKEGNIYYPNGRYKSKNDGKMYDIARNFSGPTKEAVASAPSNTIRTSSNKSGGSVVSPAANIGSAKNSSVSSYQTNGKIANPDETLNKYVGNKGWNVTVGRAGSGDIQTVSARQQDVKSNYNKKDNDAALAGLQNGTYPVIQGTEQGNKNAAYPWPHYVDSRGVAYQYHGEKINGKSDDGLMKVDAPYIRDLKAPELKADKLKPVDLEEPGKRQGDGFDIGALGKYAGIANNLIQSFKKPEKVNREYLKQNELQYQDLSEATRRESRTAANVQTSNGRNLSGGSAANMRNNAAAAQAGNAERIGKVNQFEAGRADQIQTQNIGIRNQTAQINNQKFDQYEQMDAANRAVKDAYRDTAMTDIGKVSQINEQTKYMKQLDQNKLDSEERSRNVMNTMVKNQLVGKDWDVQFRTGQEQQAAEDKQLKTQAYKKGTKSIKTKKAEDPTKSRNEILKMKLKYKK